MKIEVATEADVEQVAQLVYTCYQSQEAKKGWTSRVDLVEGGRTTPDSLRKQMASPNIKIFKGTDEDSGKMIACVLGERQGPQGETMLVGMLCVQPDIQGKGIGKQMMNAVEHLGRELNCQKLKIEMIESRNSLMGWYERQGFQRNGKTEPFPEHRGVGKAKVSGLQILEMEKLISRK